MNNRIENLIAHNPSRATIAGEWTGANQTRPDLSGRALYTFPKAKAPKSLIARLWAWVGA